MKEKFILDACCGKRMMWFNKNHPNTLYLDERQSVNPDIVGDYRKLTFKDNSFKIVVWDVPHIIQKEIGSSNVADDYGVLNPDNWKEDLTKGFKECWRVLENYGVLIFKWSDCNKWANLSRDCNIKTILSLFKQEPLFGHKTRAKFDVKENKQTSATYWFCFMKIPSSEQLIAPPSDSATQVSKADEHNISLKDNSDELSKILSNDETSLNNNIHRLRPNLKKCSKEVFN